MERRTFLEATALAGTTALAGCSSSNSGGTEQPGGGATDTPTDTPTDTSTATSSGGGGASGPTVVMTSEGGNYYFDPIGLAVDPGTTVTFKIDKGSHSSTAYKKGNGPATTTRIPEGAEAWNSDILSGAGTTFTHTFETEGTYDYFCIPHKSLGMVGRIVVGSPGGPADGSMPPDGKVPEGQTIVDQGSVSYDSFTS